MQKAILSGWLFLFVLAEEQQPHGSECGCYAERITGRTISGIRGCLDAGGRATDLNASAMPDRARPDEQDGACGGGSEGRRKESEGFLPELGYAFRIGYDLPTLFAYV